MRYFALLVILFFWIAHLNAQTISMSEFQESKKTLSKINYSTDVKFGLFYYQPWNLLQDVFDSSSVELKKSNLTAFIGLKHYLGNSRKYNVELLLMKRSLHSNISTDYYDENSSIDVDIKIKTVIFTTNILRQSKITDNFKMEYGLNLGYALHNKVESIITDQNTGEFLENEGVLDMEDFRILNLSTGYNFGLIYFVNNIAFSIRYSSLFGLLPVNGYSLGFTYKL